MLSCSGRLSDNDPEASSDAEISSLRAAFEDAESSVTWVSQEEPPAATNAAPGDVSDAIRTPESAAVSGTRDLYPAFADGFSCDTSSLPAGLSSVIDNFLRAFTTGSMNDASRYVDKDSVYALVPTSADFTALSFVYARHVLGKGSWTAQDVYQCPVRLFSQRDRDHIDIRLYAVRSPASDGVSWKIIMLDIA